MAIKPTRSEWDLGKDMFGRTTRLVEAADYMGRVGWSLQIDPSDQRDEGGSISALTADQLVSAGVIAAAASRKR